MRKIVLVCCAGMSTGMLVDKMKQASASMGYECEISAHPLAELETVKVGADAVLLGPQVRFELDKVKAACPDIMVEAVNPMDYGMMNGKNVVEHVKKVLGD